MEQLAEASGVSSRTIGDTERGRTRAPQRRTVALLAGALRLNPLGQERLQALALMSAAPEPDPAGTLLGRDPELDILRSALRSARQLHGTSLVLRAGPGLGKTALLDEVQAQGAGYGFTVLSATGVPAETHLPFTGLRQLLDPLLADTDPRLRTVRDLVLRAAGEGPQTDRLDSYQVAVSALDLVTRGPRQQVLLVVDDAHWLDRQSWESIAFLARRVAAHPVTVVIAMRDGTETDQRLASAGLAELRLHPLDPVSSAALVDRSAPGLPLHRRTWVLREAAGHPLALIDLSAALATTDWAPELSTELPLSDRLLRSYTAALHTLPAATRTTLQVAAVHDSDSADEILTAAGLVLAADATVEDLHPALDASLLTVDRGRIRYRHPLIREAVRRSASLQQVRRMHTALAQVVGGQTDRGVRHRAAGALGPDDDLAADLAALARKLNRKGALADAADAWEQAARHSSDPQRRAVWRYEGVVAAIAQGDTVLARRLSDAVDPTHLPATMRSSYLRTQENNLSLGWAPIADLASAAADIARLHGQGHTDLAVDALSTMSLRCFWTPPGPADRAALIDVVEGFGLHPLDHRLFNIRAHVAPVERGRVTLDTITALLDQPLGRRPGSFSVGIAASGVGAHPQAKAILTADISGYRARGAVGNLAEALVSRAFVCAQLGEVTPALAAAQEAQLLSDQVGRPFWALAGRLSEAQAEALRGDAATALALVDQIETSLLAYGPHPFLSLVQLVRGIAYLAQGRPTDAYDALARILDPNDPAHHQYVGLAAMPHLAEAGSSSPERREDLRTLTDATRATAELCGWPPLLIGLAQADALLAGDDRADQAYTSALNAIPAPWAFERARTQLAYGSWLRRQHQTGRARPQLQAAWHIFRALSTAPWAQRAGAELRATGTDTPQPGETADEAASRPRRIPRG